MSKLFISRIKKSSKTTTEIKSSKNHKTSIKSKIINNTSHWNFPKITKYFLVFGVIIALVSSYFWYSQIYMNPERRFWIALNNSMATPSVVRTLTQGGSGNQVAQQYRFNFAPQRVVQNKVVYTEKSSTTDTTVTTEGIIYPEKQYLRYTDFTNSRTDSQNSSNIDSVLGAWAVQEVANPEELEQSRLSYLSEQVSLVIFGNYGPDVRNEVLSKMQDLNVYGDNLSLALKDSVDGEDVYVYSIEVKLKHYAEILNDAFIKAGYGEFPPLNPDNYAEDATVNGIVKVSKRTNSVISVSFGDREEIYGNYGVLARVEEPQASMTVEELQSEVQQLLESDF